MVNIIYNIKFDLYQFCYVNDELSDIGYIEEFVLTSKRESILA